MDWNNLPEWMKDYSKRDLSLIRFAVENATAFYAINPGHPLAVHCMELRATIEAANALEATKQTDHMNETEG